MVTVARVVEKLVKDRPFLEEALVRGIVNYAYLADSLKPYVEKELKKGVKRSAVIMALRRFAESLGESFVAGKTDMFRDADITMKSGIFEITVIKDSDTIPSAMQIYDMVDTNRGDLLTITFGLYEITILTNSKYEQKIKGLFTKRQTEKAVAGLSALIIKIPPDAVEMRGVLYSLTKALSWENVNIVEVVSTLTEEIFFIREEDTAVAFNAVKAAISSGN